MPRKFRFRLDLRPKSQCYRIHILLQWRLKKGAKPMISGWGKNALSPSSVALEGFSGVGFDYFTAPNSALRDDGLRASLRDRAYYFHPNKLTLTSGTHVLFPAGTIDDNFEYVSSGWRDLWPVTAVPNNAQRKQVPSKYHQCRTRVPCPPGRRLPGLTGQRRNSL
jgi:hypothetical protein